jgi:co-chaperonin GroES (HSP10)
MKRKSKFVPYYDKIHVKLFEEDSLLKSEQSQFEQMGTVIAVGTKVKFCKPGDFIYFLKHGCEKTPEHNGESYYVVTDNPNIILGKHGRDTK